MAFDDIIGNSSVKKILRKALKQKKLPNSLLFVGQEGVGKEETALVVAKALNCQNRQDDACEACSSCKAVNSGKHPDVMLIGAQKGALKIDHMREIKEIAYLRPMVGAKRVFIVLSAEKMTVEASNSLLKILEEPPFFSHIILVTQNPHLILPTIKSRCQRLNFSSLSNQEIQEELQRKGYKEQKARVIALLVRGNLDKALSLDWDETQERRNAAWNIFLACLKGEKTSPFIRQFSSSQMAVKNELERILETISSFCRDLILIKEKGELRFLLNPDYEKKFRETEHLIGIERVMGLQAEVDFALYALQKNLNVNLLVSSIFSNWGEWKNV